MKYSSNLPVKKMCGGGLNSGNKVFQESRNLPRASTEKQYPNLGGLQKGGRKGPNMCMLCMGVPENNFTFSYMLVLCLTSMERY